MGTRGEELLERLDSRPGFRLPSLLGASLRGAMAHSSTFRLGDFVATHHESWPVFFFFFRQNQEIVGVPVANSGGVNHAVEPPSSEGKPPDSAGSARRSRLLDRSGTAQ